MEHSIIVMTIVSKSNEPNKTYQNNAKNIKQSKQKNNQIIYMEAKVGRFQSGTK